LKEEHHFKALALKLPKKNIDRNVSIEGKTTAANQNCQKARKWRVKL